MRRVQVLNCEYLKVVEIVWEQYVWNGTRPIPSVHKHVGYVTYESSNVIRIAPELTYSSENRQLRVKHEQKAEKLLTPIPTLFPLEKSTYKTNIMQIDYADPFHKDGVLSDNEAKSFKPSTLRLLGFFVQEDERYFWIALATFEYIDGQVDYETVHVIPKPAILKLTFFKRK